MKSLASSACFIELEEACTLPKALRWVSKKLCALKVENVCEDESEFFSYALKSDCAEFDDQALVQLANDFNSLKSVVEECWYGYGGRGRASLE